MKKACPDLVAMGDTELKDFWGATIPEDLKMLGDRLLAESLPRFPDRPSEFYAADLDRHREGKEVTIEQMARRLGVSRNLLRAWEQGLIRPPASLKLVYQRL